MTKDELAKIRKYGSDKEKALLARVDTLQAEIDFYEQMLGRFRNDSDAYRLGVREGFAKGRSDIYYAVKRDFGIGTSWLEQRVLKVILEVNPPEEPNELSDVQDTTVGAPIITTKEE